MPGPLAAVPLSVWLAAGQAAAQTATQATASRRQYKWNKKAAEDSNRANRENQQWLLEQERMLQQEQREYDSPKAQMERYIAAGLNPHLIYGTGSSAGNAFPIHAGNLPAYNVAPPSVGYPDPVGSFIGASNQYAQTQLTQARTSESWVNQALKDIQIDIAKTNPMLNPTVASWVSDSMEETARLKTMESRSWMSNMPGSDAYMKITAKVNSEVEAMTQRLGLNTADLAIKNRILESKEFENAVKQIQAQWLRDGDLTPEHIRQGLMLLLTKMLGH